MNYYIDFDNTLYKTVRVKPRYVRKFSKNNRTKK
jgi:hypothetical protein